MTRFVRVYQQGKWTKAHPHSFSEQALVEVQVETSHLPHGPHPDFDLWCERCGKVHA